MTASPPPQAPQTGPEVRAAEPGDEGPLVLAEAEEDDELARQRALASTYDPLIAHAGKHDEQLIKERQDATLLAVDLAIAASIVLALRDDDEAAPQNGPDNEDDGREAEPAEADDTSLGD